MISSLTPLSLCFVTLLNGIYCRFGSTELKKEFLLPSIMGDKVACLGVSEVGAGSDVASTLPSFSITLVFYYGLTSAHPSSRFSVNTQPIWDGKGGFIYFKCGGHQSTSMIKTLLMANDSMKITNIYIYSLVSSCSKQEELQGMLICAPTLIWRIKNDFCSV